MIRLLFNILICFSLSKSNDEFENKRQITSINQQKVEKQQKEKDEYDLTFSDPKIVREEWMKKKLEIHRKIAEIEARHHEEEVEDDEDGEHLKKIEKIIDEELDKKKFYKEYDKSKLAEIRDLEEAVLPSKEKTVEPTKRLVDRYYDDLRKKKSSEEKEETHQMTFTSHHEIAKTIKDDKSNMDQITPQKTTSYLKSFFISFSVLTAAVLCYFAFNKQIKRCIGRIESDELPNSIKYK